MLPTDKSAGNAPAPAFVDVLVVGGGPCGLTTALELGRRGVRVLLVDDKPGTAFNPQANATQARTMEHFRRLGFADEIRALGMPADFPTDVAYYTRFARHELARFRLPSSGDARRLVRTLDGSWSAAELPHRVAQKFVEPVLRRQAARWPGVELRYGWRMTGFTAGADHVDATIEPAIAEADRAGAGPQAVRARYLVGADGPRSTTRQALGIRYAGEANIRRDFLGGRMQAVYLRAPRFYDVVPHGPAWMNVTFNRQRRALMAAVDGRGEFAFHTQLRADESEDGLDDARAAALFHEALGLALPIEILGRASWIAGHCLVAEQFGRDRVLLAGDAVHLFTPTGGLGYNTGIEDAVNLGWKLAAVLAGTAPPALLDSYEAERRPLAVRNTGHARRFADSLGLYEPPATIEDETPEGESARRAAGAYLADHGRREFDIPGITFGGRYDGSPIVVGDGSVAPPDRVNVYEPTACPGGRPPHLWLADGESLYDRFGRDWTLLRLGRRAPPAEGFAAAARRRGLALSIVAIEGDAARDLYQADLCLIRPDQIVAWRGNDDAGADAVLAQATGATAATGRQAG